MFINILYKIVFIFPLQTSEVGLTEHVKGDKKKFELWLGGRVDVYTFLVSSISNTKWKIQVQRGVVEERTDRCDGRML